MRISKLFALALAGLVFTAPMAHADEAAAASADAARTSDVRTGTDADDRMICDYEKRVGTNMKTRICKTVAERRREHEQSKKFMDARVICGTGCSR